MESRPLWISHRGYKENACENTRAAFQAAVPLGFSCLETDLRASRDGQIVLVHDPTLARLAGDQRRVSDMTAAELAGIRLKPPCQAAGARAGVDFFDDRLLFFDAFAAEFSQCRWVLDIKPEGGRETILALARWAAAEGMVESVSQNAKILTWRAGHEALAKKYFPGAAFYARRLECWRAGLTVLLGQPSLGAIQPGKTYALPPSVMGINLFQPHVVQRFHKRRAAVVAFLPPTDEQAKQAVAAGFDEILTNGSRLRR